MENKRFFEGPEGREIDIGQLENAVHKNTIEDELKTLDALLEFGGGGFTNLYLLCPNEILPKVSDYIRRKLSISGDSVFRVTANDSRGDIQNELNSVSDKLLDRPESRKIVLVEGFEEQIRARLGHEAKYPKILSELGSQHFRWAHDYDQNIKEEFPLRKKLSAINAAVLVVTHVDTNINDELLSSIKSTIAASQFKDGWIVIEKLN